MTKARQLKLDEVVVMPDGDWRVTKILDGNDAGLVVMNDEADSGRGVVAHACWVTAYIEVCAACHARDDELDAALERIRELEARIGAMRG